MMDCLNQTFLSHANITGKTARKRAPFLKQIGGKSENNGSD
jgi:hypothetical protein